MSTVESDGSKKHEKKKICSVFLRVLSYTPRYKKHILIVSLLMSLGLGLRLLSPYVGGRMFFDQVLSPEGRFYGNVFEIIMFMILIQALTVILSVMHKRTSREVAGHVVFDLKTEVFTAMQRLSLSFYNEKETGALITNINYDTQKLETFFHQELP